MEREYTEEEINHAARRCFYAEAKKKEGKFVIEVWDRVVDEMKLKDDESLEVIIRRPTHPIDTRGFYGSSVGAPKNRVVGSQS